MVGLGLDDHARPCRRGAATQPTRSRRDLERPAGRRTRARQRPPLRGLAVELRARVARAARARAPAPSRPRTPWTRATSAGRARRRTRRRARRSGAPAPRGVSSRQRAPGRRAPRARGRRRCRATGGTGRRAARAGRRCRSRRSARRPPRPASRSRSNVDRLEHPASPPAGRGRACRRRRTGAPCPPACPCCRSAGARASRRGARSGAPTTRGALAAQQLRRVRVLLLRHDRGARRPRVGHLGRSRTPREDHSTISAPSRERWVAQVAAADRKSSTKSRFETASIEFGATPAKPSSRGDQRRGRSRSSRPRARPRRAAARSSRRARTRSAARRAGTSRSTPAGGARGRRAGRAGGACSRASPSPRGARRAATSTLWSALQRLERLQRVRAREHRHVGGDLVVARARGVQLAADRPDDLGQPPLDRHVDVLVVLAERERAVVELRLDARRARRAARRGRPRR